ncbi:hypothetical protein [Wolbachia endosymbiont (group A) of Rhinocyllus conicus]|uniref:hypothetical protein n=1 Tax=Wolbachia endosymbiont (group A) of Rhinocyllus conicus TaxID=2954053 RepID=UPI002226E054|nr:hypothetical protein [Wolbachia endosymbiont (group A) of Rhinocyllus conicus]
MTGAHTNNFCFLSLLSQNPLLSSQHPLLSSQHPLLSSQHPLLSSQYLILGWLCCIATYERLTIARIISNLLKILFFCNQSDQI